MAQLCATLPAGTTAQVSSLGSSGTANLSTSGKSGTTVDYFNVANGSSSEVVGGQYNTVLGDFSVILGGSSNRIEDTVDGMSLASGTNSYVSHSLAAVFSFTSTRDVCESLSDSSVSFCADNGVHIVTSTSSGLFVNNVDVMSTMQGIDGRVDDLEDAQVGVVPAM